MYQKVLVPLDGSKLSECALEHVRAVAKGCNVPEVILMTVIEPVHQQIYGVSDDWLVDMKRKAIKAAESSLEKIAGDFKKEGVAAVSVVQEGNAAETILDYASKNNIDLIIMTTHGRSGPSRWAFGSVTDKIVRTSTIPVLIATPPGCRINL